MALSALLKRIWQNMNYTNLSTEPGLDLLLDLSYQQFVWLSSMSKSLESSEKLVRNLRIWLLEEEAR